MKYLIIKILIMSAIWYLILWAFAFDGPAYGMDVTLSWDPNQEPDLAGYYVYYGLSSGYYAPDPGSSARSYALGGKVFNAAFLSGTSIPKDYTDIRLNGLPDQTHYFALSAFDGPIAGVDSVISGEGELSDEFFCEHEIVIDSRTIEVAWSAHDVGSGVSVTELWFKGVEGEWQDTGQAQVGESGVFYLDIDEMEDGEYFLMLKAVDVAGNKGTGVSRQVFIDSVPPEAEILNIIIH